MSLAPGSTIGIVGGGQLGRMMALAAARMGYKCHIYDPHYRPCAAEVAGTFTRGAFDDADALARFAKVCDVVTYEFENVPVGPLAALGGKLRPTTRSLEIAQDRVAEKHFLGSIGIPVAPWRQVDTAADAAAAEAALGLPLVFKTRRLGYDGKGQAWARDPASAAATFASIGEQPAVAETAMTFDAEFSVIVARWEDGTTASWDIVENEHRDGILHRSRVPASVEVAMQSEEARAMALKIVAALDHVGVLTVEFFACPDGPMVNEIAPRVHNSGHWTIEGAVTSQFEQHVRAICDLPPGATVRNSERVEMENLIGSDVERWPDFLEECRGYLHLYNKGDARPGRKMGHVTRLK